MDGTRVSGWVVDVLMALVICLLASVRSILRLSREREMDRLLASPNEAFERGFSTTKILVDL